MLRAWNEFYRVQIYSMYVRDWIFDSVGRKMF